ncbi:GM19538 [Drosophila sechellia]|uniref:GM19538 n=1 Tax=Drosophila sechellia TaxID=7238 RepID=B4HWE4_DROSE|nr:GM19538 [Drosophila sechellia]
MMMRMMMMGNTGSWAWEQLSLNAFPFFDTLMKCKIICLNGQKLSLDEMGMPLLWLSRCIKMKLISIPGPKAHLNQIIVMI